jgi:hypothetical protein
MSLSELLESPILEIDGCLLISRERGVKRHLSSFPGDPVGFEAFASHVHLKDIAGQLPRKRLVAIGESVIRAWSERLKAVLRGRSVLFYLGGSSDVTLRFHVIRDACANWVDLSDKAFRRKEKLKIFRLTEEGLVEEK